MAGDWDLCGTWRLLRLVYLSDALSASLAAISSSICQVPRDRSGGRNTSGWKASPVWQSSGKEMGHRSTPGLTGMKELKHEGGNQQANIRSPALIEHSLSPGDSPEVICPHFMRTLELVKRNSPDLMAGHLNPTPPEIKCPFTISSCSELRISGI